MCGICGVIGPAADQGVDRMVAAMGHRGPDDSGQFEDKGFALGHTRLAIIDTSAGAHQPMSNPNGSVWIAYNGEAYNYREERVQLAQKGHVFTTSSDTEVVLRLYEQYGIEFLSHLRGMFALAIYDRRSPRPRLLLARDPFGIKPLLYSQIGESLIFASELKALLASGKGLTVKVSGRDFDATKFIAQFDCVFSFHVLEHVADPLKFLEDLCSFVKPGGKIGLSVPNQDGPIDYIRPCVMNMPPHHATRWRLRTFETAAEKLGLKIKRVAYEPLLLDNYSYYSYYWLSYRFPGTTAMRRVLRKAVSLSLQGVFGGLRLIGLRHLYGLRGQSIYILFGKPHLSS